MGAETFKTRSKGKTPAKAFLHAVEKAQWDHGHSGYSGTIAEKSEYTIIKLPVGQDASKYADELIDACDKRIDDKWGPAGAIQLGPDEWLFFGWASS